MAKFRVNKTRDYTVISNYHLKDKTISLKAKGTNLEKDYKFARNIDYEI